MVAGSGGRGRGRRGGARPGLRIWRLLLNPPSSEADSVVSLASLGSLSGSLAVSLRPPSDRYVFDVGGCGHRRTPDSRRAVIEPELGERVGKKTVVGATIDCIRDEVGW